MSVDTQTRATLVRLPDGRTLDVLVAGPTQGLPLVFHYGTPCGLAEFDPMIDAASERGLRTIIYARPGYARSTSAPGRMVSDAAVDTAHLLNVLGHHHFVTIGWSGGGPHALACAAGLPGRCLAAATIAGVAPYQVDGLDWLNGMGRDNLEEYGTALHGESELGAYLAVAAADMAQVAPHGVADTLGEQLAEIDQRTLTGAFAEFMATMLSSALSTGVDGWRDDDLAFMGEWGFGFDRIAPVSIWQGGQDRMVPYQHGIWLAENIAGARSHLFPEEGHLSLAAEMFPDILDDLLDLTGHVF
jgi:pimeloyl-ACP methyl ester carboxylesterase